MEEENGDDTPDPSKVFAERLANGAKGVADALGRMNALLFAEIQRTTQLSDAIELARAYVHAKQAIEAIEAGFDKKFKVTFNILKTKDWPRMLEKRGIQNVPLSDLGFVVGTTNYTTVTQMNEDACTKFLLNHEEPDEAGNMHKPYAGAMKYGIHHKTLGGIAAQLAKKGKELPTVLRDEEGKPVKGPDGQPIALFQTTVNEIATMRKAADKKD